MAEGRTFPVATLVLGTALAAAGPTVGSPQETPPAREGDREQATRAAEQAPPPTPTTSDPEAIREERELAHRRRHIAEPMGAGEIAALGERLALPPEGRTRLAEMATAYATSWEALREQDERAMLVLVPASFSYDHQSQDIDPVHTPELLVFLRLREKHRAAVDSIEDGFWDELETLTPIDRRGEWLARRLERTRTLHDHPARLPAAGIDIAELLPTAGLLPAEITSLSPEMADYREDLDRALRRRDRALRELELRQAEELVNLGPEWRAGRTDAEALEVDRQLATYAIATILADTELRDLNRATLESLRKVLMPVSSRKLVEAYQRLVHPSLFEDERSFRRLVESALAIPLGGEEASLAAVELLAGVEDRLRPSGYAAVDMADGILATEALPPGDAATARILLEIKLQQTLAKRRDAIRGSVNQLRDLLASGPPELLAKIDDAAKAVAAQDRAASFLIAGLASRLGEVEALRALGEEPARPQAEGDSSVQVEPSIPDAPPAATPPSRPDPPRGGGSSRGGRGSRGGR